MRRVYSRYGTCTACLELRELQGHHIVPQRYEKATNNSPMCHLYQGCHNELHRDWIDPLGHVSRSEFIRQTRQFLWEKRN